MGRIAFQEFFTDDSIAPEDQSPLNKVLTNKYFATILTLLLCYALSRAGYASIWPLFGSANQLLSALALIACAVFLKKTKRQGAMLWGPMVIMLRRHICGSGFKDHGAGDRTFRPVCFRQCPAAGIRSASSDSGRDCSL